MSYVTEGECGMAIGSWLCITCTIILAAVYVLDKIMHLNMLLHCCVMGYNKIVRRKKLIFLFQEMFCMLQTVWSCVTERYNLVRGFYMLGRIPLGRTVLSGMLVKRMR
jgi:hypothetical protein